MIVEGWIQVKISNKTALNSPSNNVGNTQEVLPTRDAQLRLGVQVFTGVSRMCTTDCLHG